MADKDREKSRSEPKDKKESDKKEKDARDKKDKVKKDKSKDSPVASSRDGVSPRHDHHSSDGKAKKQDDSHKHNDDHHDRKDKDRKERSPSRRDKDEKRDKDDKKELSSPRHERPAHRSPRRDEDKAPRSKERSPSRKEKERSPTRKDDNHDKDRAKRVSVAATSSSKDKESREGRDEKRMSSSARDKERLDRDREKDTDKRHSKYGTVSDGRQVHKDRPALSSIHGSMSRASGQTLASPNSADKKAFRASMQVPSDLSLDKRSTPPTSPSGKRISIMPGPNDQKSRSGKNLSLFSSDNRLAKNAVPQKMDDKAAPVRPVPRERDKEREEREKREREREREREEREKEKERKERKEREEKERKLRKEREEKEKKERDEREKKEKEEREREERERRIREEAERREKEERELKLKEAQEDFERAEKRAREDREIEERRTIERARRRSQMPSGGGSRTAAVPGSGTVTPSSSNNSLSTLATSPAAPAATSPTPTPMPNSSPQVPPKPTLKLPGSGSVTEVKPAAKRTSAEPGAPKMPKSPRAKPAGPERIFLLSEDASMEPRARKRNMILNEIIKTERDYIRDLAVMREAYEFPIKHQKLLPDDQTQPLFYNIEAILGFNKVLYEDLVNSAEKSNGDSVGSCFLKFADFLKMYAIYCSNHENAGKIYENVMATNLQFAEWINQQKLTNPAVKGAGLESYLIKPVQRLCRYPLLLKELLKETDPKHPDFAKISNALDKIQAVINKVNEFKRKFEGEVNVLEVQKRISGCPPLVAPNRRLLKEGHLRALCGVDEGKVKDSQLFMFNDLLVVARLKQRKAGALSSVANSVSVDNLIGLAKQATATAAPAVPPKPVAASKPAPSAGSTGFYFKFKDMMPLAVILLTDRKDGATKNAFEIFAKKLGGGQSKHVFFTFKKEDKDDWMKAILQQAADALNDDEEEEEEPEASEKAEEWSEDEKPKPLPKEEIPAPWEKHCDPDGNVYYWNPDTDDSVWTLADIPRATPVPPTKGH